MLSVPYLTIPEVGSAPSPASVAMSLAARPEVWRPLVAYRVAARWFRLLRSGADREVWLLSWLPGQHTELHDHGASHGAFAVAAGMLTERVVSVRSGVGPVETSRQLDVGRVRIFGPHYIHQVSNIGDVPAVSIHVYEPGRVMTHYQVDADGVRPVSTERSHEPGPPSQ